MLKIIFQALLILLPWLIRRRMLELCFGFELHPTSRIGLSLVLAGSVRMDEGTRIGSFNMIKGLRLLELEPHGRIGSFNWITGYPAGRKGFFGHVLDRDPSLLVKTHAAITSRHLIDATSRVTIGEFATFAGFRSQILTHGIDIALSRQDSSPVTIGAYSFIGTGSIITMGSSVPDHCVVAAGAVVASELEEPYILYGGVPAKKIRSLSNDSAYFVRPTGYVR